MKKFLYFFGILALIAGVVTSCSKDEDEENDNCDKVGSKKRWTKIYLDNDIYDIKYDNEGRCISISSFYNGETRVSRYLLYKYDGDKMIEEEYGPDSSLRSTNTIRFNTKGFLQSEENDEGHRQSSTSYEYDNQGHLISETFIEEGGYSRTTTYEWKDGNVTKFTWHIIDEGQERHEEYSFKYTNERFTTPIENKAGFSIMQIDDAFEPQYFKTGMPLKNLPVYMEYKSGDEKMFSNVNWSIDSDGYPLEFSTDLEYGYTIKYVWE